MLRLKNLANKYQKRTCRPLYANTQATPYAASLYVTDSRSYGFRDTDGSLVVPPYNSAPTKLSSATYKGGLVPGTVLVRVKGTEQVTVATGAAGEKPFGLLANFVGGQLDEGFEGDSLQNQVGVWRGPDSVFELLAPAFGTVTVTASTTGASDSVLLYAGADGLLTTTPPNTTSASTEGPTIAAISGGAVTQQTVGSLPVARLIEKTGSSRIVVDLLV